MRVQSYDEFLGKTNRPKPTIIRFALIFCSIFLLLQWGYQTLTNTPAYHFYLEQLTVRPSAFLIQLAFPQDGVTAQAHRLIWSGGRISVLNGCDGADAFLLLISGFGAVSGSWRMKLTGMAIGSILVYILNQIRLLALYFAIRHEKALFDLLHSLIGPLIIIALTTIFFAWWTTPRES